MNKRSNSNLKTIVIYVAVIVLIFVLLSNLFSGANADKTTYSDVVKYFREAKVEKFVVSEDGVLSMKLRDTDGQISYQLKSTDYFREDLGDLIDEQLAAGIIESYEYEPATVWPWWVSLLPYVIMIVLFIAFYAFMMKNMMGGGKNGKGGMNFGRARVKTAEDATSKVTFADVAGAAEEKEELREIVEFLKNPQKFTSLGAKIPHGVLLMGPPGTGKTLLAKAVAGEAEVPFYSISGSDFVEMYVGVGASRVRDLFETARRSPASIVFIDEIDAVGRHRGAGLGGGHDEREQTLNQLLVEMDGFGAHDGIIVIAATNRADILDPALLRPGRFDRQITVNYPDINGREEILKVHARNKKFEDGVDFAVIARTTSGFTGADLANLLNEAALLAVRRGKALIGMEDIEDAFTKVIAGPQKKSMRMQERERKNTAYHEAGHALLSYLQPHVDNVHSISIIPSGQALGITLTIPEEDKYSVYKEELKERISMLLAGRAAEMQIFGDYSGGASNDIKRATEIAHKMVTELGMSSELGPIRYGSGQGDIFLGRDFSSHQDYSEATAAKIDSEVKKIIDEAFAEARRLLRENSDKLEFVAQFLLAHETMDGDQFRAAMERQDPSVEEIELILEEKKRKSRNENAEQAKKNAETKNGNNVTVSAEDGTCSSDTESNEIPSGEFGTDTDRTDDGNETSNGDDNAHNDDAQK